MSLRRVLIASLFPSVAVLILLWSGCATSPTGSPSSAPLAADDRAAFNARVFDAAWELVNEKYYDPQFRGVDWPAMRTRHAAAARAAPDDDALYRVLQDLVGELRDKHVYVLSPRQWREGRDQSRFPGSDGSEFVSRELAGGVRYLRFDRFDARANWWFVGEVKAHRDAAAMIIDLRQNGGGGMDSLRRAAGQFFSQRRALGQIVERSGRVRTAETMIVSSARYAGKVAILTSESTGRSAEILAHALQFYRRATVVGQRTPGAMVGGELYSLPGGGRLFVAEVDYLGLEGHSLEGVGVTPDVVVPANIAHGFAGEDTVLDAALAVLHDSRG